MRILIGGSVFSALTSVRVVAFIVEQWANG